jgi:hypothetical protein
MSRLMGLAKEMPLHNYPMDSMDDRITISVPLRRDLKELLAEESKRLGVDESTLATKIVIEHLLQVKDAARNDRSNESRPGGGCFIIE